MRYDEYLARGLPIGSGRVEAACKTVVGRRLKCTGMRLTVAGANPVLWVRCARLSGWYDDYWDERLRQAAGSLVLVPTHQGFVVHPVGAVGARLGYGANGHAPRRRRRGR